MARRVAYRVFFFLVYSVEGAVLRPFPIIVVVPAWSRSVLRSQVTARRPLVGLMAVPVCAFVGCAAIRCCSYVPPGRTLALAELASGAHIYICVPAVLRLNLWGSPWLYSPNKCLRSGLAGDGFFLSSRWPFWDFFCVETSASQRNVALLAHLLAILLAARESLSSHFTS